MSGSDTRAAQNRRIRQEELREKLRAGGHLQHAIDSITKMEASDNDLDLKKHKAVFDSHCKLLNKYLPDLKATEISGEGGDPIQISEIIRKIVK